VNFFICFLIEWCFWVFYQAQPIIIWKASFFGGEILRPNLQISPRLIKEIGQRGGDQHLRPTNQPAGAVKPVTRSCHHRVVRNKLRSFETHMFTSNIILFNFKSSWLHNNPIGSVAWEANRSHLPLLVIPRWWSYKGSISIVPTEQLLYQQILKLKKMFETNYLTVNLHKSLSGQSICFHVSGQPKISEKNSRRRHIVVKCRWNTHGLPWLKWPYLSLS